MGRLCPAVTGLQKPFGSLCTIERGSLWAPGSKPGFQLQRWVQEGQGQASGEQRGGDRAAQALGHGVVAFAGTASLSSDEDGERKGMPQRQGTARFPCSRARGRQQGCRGALLPDPSQEGKQDSRERRHGSVPAALLCSTPCTHSTFPPSLGRQNPLCSAATAATTLQSPCAIPGPANPAPGADSSQTPSGGCLREKRAGCQREPRSAAPRCSVPAAVGGGGSRLPPHLEVSNIYR